MPFRRGPRYLVIDLNQAEQLLGDALSAAANCLLGRYQLRLHDCHWFANDGHSLEHAQSWFQRYGIWSLLLAWLPVAGDALTVITDIMRVRFPVSVVLAGIGKGSRYAALLLVSGKVFA